MSVFTPVSSADADALLARYTLGAVERLEGIAQGVENTNYFLTTTTGEYVLTLFETIAHEDLPFYMGLMDHLAHHEVRCPAPMAREDGEFIGNVNGKVYMTRVTPRHGRGYVMLDQRGDGTFTRMDTLEPGLRVPQWVLFEF